MIDAVKLPAGKTSRLAGSHANQISSVSSLQNSKPVPAKVVEYMAPKEAHTISEVKNGTKITFEVPIKKPKHTRNGRQD